MIMCDGWEDIYAGNEEAMVEIERVRARAFSGRDALHKCIVRIAMA